VCFSTGLTEKCVRIGFHFAAWIHVSMAARFERYQMKHFLPYAAAFCILSLGSSAFAMNGVASVSGQTTCSATTEGTITYDNVAKTLRFCNGTSWAPIDSAGNGALQSLGTAQTAGATCASTDRVALDSTGAALVCKGSPLTWQTPP
jgi:hypothetical protein